MYHHQGVWYSSFMTMYDQPDTGISDTFQVLSVRSASSGDGRHVSMYLEFTDPDVAGCYVTKFFELTAGQQGRQPTITIDFGQVWSKDGNSKYENPRFMKGDQVRLLNTHHTSYVIDAETSAKVVAAARRYSQKTDAGRYIYHQQGGRKARLSAAFKKGKTAVNCADFVMKILREAGIVDIKTKWISTPLRAAKPG